MLRLTVVLDEGFDEEKQEFVVLKSIVIEFEHSLVSLSKWESEWEKPFLGDTEKSDEQVLDYVRMMILGEPPSEEDFSRLTPDHLKAIDKYINRKMTATWFSEHAKAKPNNEIVTAELIYYWMISLGIPLEWENRHLNKLLTLIRVCNIKNMPSKKMSSAEAGAMQRALNAQRRKETGSSG